MITTMRTDSSNSDFIHLVHQLDLELEVKNGDEQNFYSQFNTINAIKNVILAYEDQKLAGCGAFKMLDKQSVEIKRMYTSPQFRGQGIASTILAELEKWAVELSFINCVLETGKKQVEAIKLYASKGFLPIANYGPYIGVENSLCFKKKLVKF